jgi:hypothetical protein
LDTVNVAGSSLGIVCSFTKVLTSRSRKTADPSCNPAEPFT